MMIQSAILLVALLPNSSNQATLPTSHQPNLEALRRIAAKLLVAVQKRDSDTILSYDFPDLRREHQSELSNTNSDLYCYLYDSRCPLIGDKTDDSIYGRVKRMKAPKVAIWKNRSNLYSILFYDAKRLTYKQAISKACEIHLPAWTFRWTNEGWKAEHPVFNSEIDSYCD